MNASILPDLTRIMQANLEQLEREIGSFEQRHLWEVKPGVFNSAGNLTLHLVGNLNHYIGAILGKTGYVRDRDNEFAAKDIALDQLLEMIRKTTVMIGDVLRSLPDEELAGDYPVVVFGKPMSSRFFLLHLSAHLAYHLGQINYLCRILQG